MLSARCTVRGARLDEEAGNQGLWMTMTDIPLRTPDRLRHHFDVERELADRLRRASREERRTLYATVYDELFQRVPDHPQLSRKGNAEQRLAFAQAQLRELRTLLTPESTFLEIGAGDCALSYAVAPHVRQVYALEVSEEIVRSEDAPPNVELVISDGTSIPVPEGSIDLAYSNQVMEHLHPDDAREQLANIQRALVPGGIYVCVTPNRLAGPHDISRYFPEETAVAVGFHLKEYTLVELRDLFRDAGFSSVRRYLRFRGRYVSVPVSAFILLETVLSRIPSRLRNRLTHHRAIGGLLALRVGGSPSTLT